MTTKLHVAVDALGNPLRVILSAGQVADIEQAEALIKDPGKLDIGLSDISASMGDGSRRPTGAESNEKTET